MKRLFFLLGCLSPFVVFQLVTSCADPLTNGQSAPTSPTTPQTDTIVIVDTSYIVDSVFIVDSTFIIDTLISMDTSIIVPQNDSIQHCSRIGSGQHEIVWLLQNQSGNYHLEFAALAEQGKPKQTVIVDINGHQYKWNPADQGTLILDQHLVAKTIIRIELSVPVAYGHAIDICLLMSRRQ